MQLKDRVVAGVPLALLLCTGLSSFNFGQSISTLFLQSRGQHFNAIFSLESITLVAMLLVEVPTGHLADRFGPRALVRASFAAQFLSQTIFTFSHSYLAFAAASILSGVSVASLSGSREIYVLEFQAGDKERRGLTHSYALLNQASLVAGAISAGVGGQLATIQLVLPVALSAVFYGAGFVLCLALPSGGRSLVNGRPGTSRTSLWAALSAIRRSPILFFFSLLPQFALLTAINPILQPLLLAGGLDLHYIGWVIAGGTLLAAVLSQAIRVLERFAGLVASYAVALLLAGVGYLLASFHGALLVVCGFYLVVIAMNFCVPISSSIKAKVVPVGARATTLSVSSFCGSLVAAAVNLGIGALSDLSIVLTLKVLAVVLAAVALAWVVVARADRRRLQGAASAADVPPLPVPEAGRVVGRFDVLRDVREAVRRSWPRR